MGELRDIRPADAIRAFERAGGITWFERGRVHRSLEKGIGAMEYVIVIHTAEDGGYWAEFPALDGCFVQGESIDDILRDAPDAIASHLEALDVFGASPPHRETVIITTVLAPSAA